MTVKKSLESKIRGWLPQEVIIPKVSARDVAPLGKLKKLRYRTNLAILSLLLVSSAIPILRFLFLTRYSQLYLDSLLKGSAFITVNLQMGFLEIVSKTLTLVPLKITFLALTIYIASVVVFCLSLILMARTLYKAKTKREVLPEMKA